MKFDLSEIWFGKILIWVNFYSRETWLSLSGDWFDWKSVQIKFDVNESSFDWNSFDLSEIRFEWNLYSSEIWFYLNSVLVKQIICHSQPSVSANLIEWNFIRVKMDSSETQFETNLVWELIKISVKLNGNKIRCEWKFDWSVLVILIEHIVGVENVLLVKLEFSFIDFNLD